MPSYFIHGLQPELVTDKDLFAPLTEKGNTLSPSGIIVCASDWQAPTLAVGTTSNQLLSYNFPDPSKRQLKIVYPAARAPHMAGDVIQTLKSRFPVIGRKEHHKLDFGAWGPLYHLFPNALTPVLQLAIPKTFSEIQLRDLGETLKPLKQKGILILGSSPYLTAFPNEISPADASDTVPTPDLAPLWILTGTGQGIAQKECICWQDSCSIALVKY